MAGRILKGVEFQPKFDKFSLGQFLFERAEAHGDKICQIDADLDQSETYESVKRRSTRLAMSLQERGVDSKDVICCCSGSCLDNSIPVISALYLGAKVVNLDPALSVRNAKHLLTLVTPRIIFTNEESLELIENCLNDSKLDSEIIVLGKSTKYPTFSDLTKPRPNEEVFRPVQVDVHDTALMFFSSGTTGLPKAICHSHYSCLQMAEIGAMSGVPLQIILHFTTFYWVGAVVTFVQMFQLGNTRIFGRVMQGESTFKMIEKYKVVTLFVVPTNASQLTKVTNPERFDVSSFTCLLTGGSPFSADQYREMTNLFPKVQIVFTYGMTETGVISIFHRHNDKLLIDKKIGSCGKASAGTMIKIVDPDTEELLGPNQQGEIRAKSGGLMIGYYGTDSTVCFDREGFLRTGDFGRYDEDDCLYVVGRMREMFKHKCWHVVPSSVEAVILEHPCVKEAVVFGIPGGEDGEIPAASVVLRENCDLGKDEIEKFVAERVSDWERLRGGVVFVESLPRTPTGKLMRNEARDAAIKLMQRNE